MSSFLSLDSNIFSIWAVRGLSIVLFGILYAVYTREATVLRKVPGPFLASITKLWVVAKQRSFKRPLVDMELHRIYGPIVRVAPNEVMVSSPKAFRTIYGAGSHFAKGEWYIGASDCGWSGPDSLDFLSEKNMEKYRHQRRAIGPAYSEKYMRDIEANLDNMIAKNIDIMHQRAGQSQDLDTFLNMFASGQLLPSFSSSLLALTLPDCLSTATFSEAKNLVELGRPDEVIHSIHRAWKYMHVAGYFPTCHRLGKWCTHGTGLAWLTRIIQLLSPLMEGRPRVKNVSSLPHEHAFAFTVNHIRERLARRDDNSTLTDERPTDIAAKLIQLQVEKGQLSDSWIVGCCLQNYAAGSETIAITISALINATVTHGCQKRIHQEIDSARRAGMLSRPPKLREMKDRLPYLSACLSESQRLHPVVGMPLVRTVPEGGCELEGMFLPAGTTVGINPWVLARDKSLYGEDAEIWRPERWLEYSQEKLKSLETYNATFGTGARSCPGKHLAQAIYTKAIPMLFSDFEWSFTDPDAEKVLQCTFSTRFVKLMMEWKVRDKATTETR
ncbi:hypothetical protein VTL71DRAFT_5276 [Oculimacula yallundae]|uniref:Cytochrome P450 n=1 Tax=Oculimacula yallundae TaxID=86028 RepID=A0ABR4C1T4_9HELO